MSDITLSVSCSGPAASAQAQHLPTLVQDQVASRLFAQDATLWGPEAVDEASKRLAWVGLARSSRPLVGQVSALRDELRRDGVRRVALCGMGGSSLAPEVMCATAGVELTVLDSSHPDQVRAALGDDLAATAVVVSSKSGSTVETDSQRRAFIQAFTDAGIDPTQRMIIVTDPGSPLDESARADGFRVVNADPSVGGRYSALTAFGLVPAGLAGVDVEELLDEAEGVADLLSEDDEANPGLMLGVAMAGTQPLRDKLVLVEAGSGIVGLGDWVEQLVAESTGKHGRGILPVVVGPDALELTGAADDATVVSFIAGDAHDDMADEDDFDDDDSGRVSADAAAQSVVRVTNRSRVVVSGGLGAQMLLWEVATAVAGRLLGINPFDQPDVESAKKAARSLLEPGSAGTDEPDFVDGSVEVRMLGDWAEGVTTLEQAVEHLLAQVDPEAGYLSVQAYLDRIAHKPMESMRDALARRTGRPVTFGWAPRFLHSTGQYHKGGPQTGVFLQITDEPAEDLQVPGRDFTFGTLIAAQAGGDAAVLAGHERPVLRLKVRDAAALERVTALLGGSL